MNAYKEYFPTKAYRIAEMRLSTLLRVERDRLDGIATALGRECAIGPDNLREQLPEILKFTEAYHAAYDQYLKAVLVQQPRPIQCRPACGNCCHHYPMSVTGTMSFSLSVTASPSLAEQAKIFLAA